MIPAYERHPYRTTMETTVTGVAAVGERIYAVLDDTIMYPEGGGQPADRGWLDDAVVVDVQRVDGEIRHFLDRRIDGGKATLRLDWERRFDHMQQHSAQHLISALAADELGWSTSSFHLGSETSDIELDAVEIAAIDRARLEARVNEEIRNARPVTSRRVSASTFRSLAQGVGGTSPVKLRTRGLPAGHEGDIRLVEISGIECNTCGGTHLSSTSEIESVALLHTEPMRGGIRLHWVAGARVRRRLHAREDAAAALRRTFETSDAELLAAAAARLDSLRRSQHGVKRLRTLLARETADRLLRCTGPVISAHFDDMDASFLQIVAGELASRAGDRPALLTAACESGAVFAVCASPDSGLDLRGAATVIADILEGRGGGSAHMIQGKAGSLRRRAEAEAALADVLDR